MDDQTPPVDPNQQTDPLSQLPVEQDDPNAPKAETPVEKPLLIPKDIRVMLPYILGAIGALVLVSVGSFSIGVGVGRAQMAEVKKVAKPTPTLTPAPTKAFSHSANPATQSWPEYKNAVLGFSFKYPIRYGKPVLPSGPGATDYATGNENDGVIIFGQKTGDSLSLQILPFAGTIDELVHDEKISAGDMHDEKIKKEFTISGAPARWYILPPQVDPDSTLERQRIYFIRNGYGYVIDADEEIKPEEIELLLSSISFSNK